ncbi:sugar transferase [Cytobacillus sp. S13-E01]|uniref:sugar transferase n=1 Tax=Cytobacillus sp. S13-E01 TaxID=3031326 RepID=UPI0023D8A2F1|nr:sugar transferase [Cytobacillus sp. S13-E01]MDF0727768.1 sugar transferase [Cytobacillus sp. S13-E01]
MKRSLDILISITILLLCSFIICCIGLLLRIKMGSPVIFKQKRPGLNGKPFYLYKFRTMIDLKNEKGEMLSDELRLTNIGMFIRKYSLDEFPQLINVLKGDMSLVGPRPLLMDYLPLYTKAQASRHLVKPGITGWAQVNGRNNLTWEEKFELDTWYVKNQNLFLDLKILILTIKKVIKKEGINQNGHVTVEKFHGSKEVNY